LREAFVKTMNDPELLGEAMKRDWTVNPTWGDELQAMARDLIGQPPRVKEEITRFLAK
jgi:hypothetical protein